MKIVVTGSLGHIGRQLTETLTAKGHSVTVISRDPARQQDIEAIGARAAIGSLHNVDFLTQTFTGADAVYCMIPPNFAAPDQVAYYRSTAGNYVQAIRQAGVPHVVHLSSYGAHLAQGTGPITGSYHAEQLMNGLEGVSVTHMRPGYFYYNLYTVIGMIKAAGFIGANYGGNDRLVLADPADIATAAAEELTAPQPGKQVRYIASDDRTCSEVAAVLGAAIGMPGLQWITMTNEEHQRGLEAAGVPAPMAANLTELGAANHSGILREDYDRHPPVLGKVKIEDFAKEFAVAFNNA